MMRIKPNKYGYHIREILEGFVVFQAQRRHAEQLHVRGMRNRGGMQSVRRVSFVDKSFLLLH